MAKWPKVARFDFAVFLDAKSRRAYLRVRSFCSFSMRIASAFASAAICPVSQPSEQSE